jgi:hypothetical protein
MGAGYRPKIIVKYSQHVCVLRQGGVERRQPFRIQVEGLHHPVLRTIRTAFVPVTAGEPVGMRIDTDKVHSNPLQGAFYPANCIEPKVRSTPDSRDFCVIGGAKIRKRDRLPVEIRPQGPGRPLDRRFFTMLFSRFVFKSCPAASFKPRFNSTGV